MRELERRVVLSVLDRKWREHLYEMDYLQEGIGLRAMAQRDPLVEYQREGFDMFAAMMDAIKEESVGYLFNLEVQVEDEAEAGDRRRRAPHEVVAKGLDAPKRPAQLQYTAPTVDGDPNAAPSDGAQRVVEAAEHATATCRATRRAPAARARSTSAATATRGRRTS